MPATYHVDAPRRFAVITWSPDKPELTEWTSTLSTVMADPAFEPGFSILSDWRAAVAPPDPQLMEALVDSIRVLIAEGVRRWATVIPGTPVAFGMGRMAELLAEVREVPIRVFQDYDEALSWVCSDERSDHAGSKP
jgi:hypothetical protein